MRRRDRRTQMWVYPSLFSVITHCFLKRRLTSDVSQFLKDLNLNESPPIPSLGSSKGKEKARPEEHSERSGAKKGKQGSQKTSAPIAEASESKVKLPTQVSLNPKSRFVFQPTSQWHAALPALGALPLGTPTISPGQLLSLSTKRRNCTTKISAPSRRPQRRIHPRLKPVSLPKLYNPVPYLIGSAH